MDARDRRPLSCVETSWTLLPHRSELAQRRQLRLDRQCTKTSIPNVDLGGWRRATTALRGPFVRRNSRQRLSRQPLLLRRSPGGCRRIFARNASLASEPDESIRRRKSFHHTFVGTPVQVSCHDHASIRASLSLADWQIANTEVPNPRWPEIRLRSYQVALCELSQVDGDLHSRLLEGLSKTRLRPAAAQNDADVTLISTAKPNRNSPIPTRLHHLESRASGLRHFDLIATSIQQQRRERDSGM